MNRCGHLLWQQGGECDSKCHLLHHWIYWIFCPDRTQWSKTSGPPDLQGAPGRRPVVKHNILVSIVNYIHSQRFSPKHTPLPPLVQSEDLETHHPAPVYHLHQCCACRRMCIPAANQHLESEGWPQPLDLD